MTHSFLVTGDEVHRIEFPDGAWIDIKRSVTAIQGARWVTASTKTVTKVSGRGKAATSTTEQSRDAAAYLEAKLKDLVVNTSEGPIDVNLLSDAAVQRILEEFEKLNPAPEDESLGESAAPS